jgi:hypothetical protein
MSKKTLNDRIDQYIISNPKQDGEIGYYKKVADIFGIHPEKARKRWRMLQEKATKKVDYKKIVKIDSEQYEFDTTEEVKSLDQVIKLSNIDTTRYNITHYQVSTSPTKVEGEIKTLFRVRVSVKAKKVDDDLSLQKKILLDEIKAHTATKPAPVHAPAVQAFVAANPANTFRNCALEINIPDLHIGKLAWKEESGEDYDIQEAVNRYINAVKNLISRVNPFSLEKIILPVGNDMINVDNKAHTTTGGTPQNCDTRFGKMFKVAKELLIKSIDYLAQYAPVDIIVVPGNHDTVTMFTLGEVLDAWYHSSDRVRVINTHAPRKYYQYGVNGLMYCHGNREKWHELGLIFATENTKLWADTKFRVCKVGHVHHSKKLEYKSVQEFQGFRVQAIPSLSANDAWHTEEGYNALRGAKAFLYHNTQGEVAEYSYYV